MLSLMKPLSLVTVSHISHCICLYEDFVIFGWVFKNEFKFETAHGSLRIFINSIMAACEWNIIQDNTNI